VGVSTEHTAYQRLKGGIPAPRSGSSEMNGQIVSEQIGSQIFIDGWAMVCPGDPEAAVALAGKAARVSHDGEAVYAAQVIAAVEALAFAEPELDFVTLLETAATFVPPGALIYRIVHDVCSWYAENARDWRATFRNIEERYGYAKYGGGCHVVPNFAVVLLALLHGEGSFQRSLMIANTAGWDTDCNSGTVGCVLGIKGGLAGIDAGVDLRGPVADRMLLPTADGGRCVTDALSEAYRIVNIGRALQGLGPLRPKLNVRFHFSLPGAVQGFRPDRGPDAAGTCRVENAVAASLATTKDTMTAAADDRLLAIRYRGIAPGRVARVGVATFPSADMLRDVGYGLAASPTLYSGQTVRARVIADPDNMRSADVRLYLRTAGSPDGAGGILYGPPRRLTAGEEANFHWVAPPTNGQPITDVGVEVSGDAGNGDVYLDWLTWDGTPHVTLGRPEAGGGDAWLRGWVNAADRFQAAGGAGEMVYRMVHDEGAGYAFQGEQEWGDYILITAARAHLAEQIGVLANVRGMRRFVAVTIGNDSVARLTLRHDGDTAVLAEAAFPWSLDAEFTFSVTSRHDGRVAATICVAEGEAVCLEGRVRAECARGAVGLMTRDGHALFGAVRIEPAHA
jgi:hypothetical protein